ncbi:MAG: N-acetylmuramoyl-L-alanine amidase [Neisseriaceae bacterium]|nr:N-acetylmuramoyl-L-alanine amidase [Neisseriaceae bacterium]
MKNFLMIALLIAMVVAGIVVAMYFLGISVSVDSLLGKKQSQEAVINNMSFKKIQDEQEALRKQQYGEDWDKPRIKKTNTPVVKEYQFKRPVLALDSGYSIKDPGMASVRGKREVEYNDRFVAELIPRIEAVGWEVKLVRGDHEYISDKHRAAQANIWDADLLLSIHHDVAPAKFLKEKVIDGNTVLVNSSGKSFEGFSMYISKQNKKYRQSLCFAQRLGFRLKPMQHNPAYFHKEHEGLNMVVKEYAIYERDIPLLYQSEIPAVQLKLGVITDEKDEAWLNDGQYRDEMAKAISKTIRAFKQYCPN